MADISDYIKNILGSSAGETVRDAIISCAKYINQSGQSSGSLAGKDASYYASFDYFGELIKKVANISFTDKLTNALPDSQMCVSSGVLFDDLKMIDQALQDILNLEVQPSEDAGDVNLIKRITRELNDIEIIRMNLAEAIESKRSETSSGLPLEIKNSTTFRDYADIINGFVMNDNINVISDPFIVKSDGKQNAGKGSAYAVVDAREYEYKLTTKSYSQNVSNDTPGKDYAGFESVQVNVTTRSGSGRSSVGRATGKNGESIDDDGMMDTKIITENTPDEGITPDEDGAVGWRHISVQITEPEWDPNATFKVTFKLKENEHEQFLYEAKDVPFDGYATYEGEEPQSSQSGYYFCGWEPSPRHIRFDTTCYAQFTNVAPSSEEISYSWEEIAEAAGGNCPIGGWKTLTLNDCQREWGTSGEQYTIPFSQHPIRMRKVASGEDGTTSTWLAMDALQPLQVNRTGSSVYWAQDFCSRKWSTSNARTFLNGDFYTKAIPDTIRSAIVPVTKYSMVAFGMAIVEEETIDMIWIPSVRELFNVPLSSNEKSAQSAWAANLQSMSALYRGVAEYYNFQNFEKNGPFYGQIFETAGGDYTVDQSIYGRGESYITTSSPSKYIVQTDGGTGSAQRYFLRSVQRVRYDGSVTPDKTRSYLYNITTSGDPSSDPRSYEGSLTGGFVTPLPYVIGFCM